MLGVNTEVGEDFAFVPLYSGILRVARSDQTGDLLRFFPGVAGRRRLVGDEEDLLRAPTIDAGRPRSCSVT